MEENKIPEEFYEILSIDKKKDIVVVDPYAISVNDLKDAGAENIVRVRRPFWGQGDISRFIIRLNSTEFKQLLKESEDKEVSEDVSTT